jgi:hypothetical protein
MELAEALELVARLSRTKNYPRDEVGVVYLAEGLIRATSDTGMNAEQIVKACAIANEWCPTDADMMAAAREMKISAASSGPRRCPLDLCDGSGWRDVCYLHTRHARPDGPAYVEREVISRAVFDQISGKLRGTNQSAYESRYRCACHPPRQDEIDKRGKYA